MRRLCCWAQRLIWWPLPRCSGADESHCLDAVWPEFRCCLSGDQTILVQFMCGQWRTWSMCRVDVAWRQNGGAARLQAFRPKPAAKVPAPRWRCGLRGPVAQVTRTCQGGRVRVAASILAVSGQCRPIDGDGLVILLVHLFLQAIAHEGFALVALFARGVHVARFHALLLLLAAV